MAEMSRTIARGLCLILFLIIASSVYLQISEQRLLLWQIAKPERKIGNNLYEFSTFECAYFSGRTMKTILISQGDWDECPLFWKTSFRRAYD